MVKQGYKPTEIGVIPEDWEVLDIQELINKNAIIGHLDGNHGALYPKSHEFVEDGIPYVGANALINGKIDFNKVKYLTKERVNTFQKGISYPKDLLFAHNATVGPVAYVQSSIDKLILSTTLTYFRSDESKLKSKYLLYEFQTERFVKQYSSVMSQSTRNQVPITAQRKFNIVLPPLAEQEAIATALSDADAWIEHLEQLIAKKRLIKQGAMQELLIPKDDWEVKKLGEVLQFGSGRDYKHLIKGEIPVYGTGGLMTHVNEFLYDGVSVGIGRKGTIDKPILLLGKFWTVDTLFYTHSFSGVIPNYIYYQFLLIPWKEYNEASGVPSLNKNTLEQIELQFPSLSEQERIATILSDLDAELEALEQQLGKAQQIKQGMMQELLTGKTRLIDN